MMGKEAPQTQAKNERTPQPATSPSGGRADEGHKKCFVGSQVVDDFVEALLLELLRLLPGSHGRFFNTTIALAIGRLAFALTLGAFALALLLAV